MTSETQAPSPPAPARARGSAAVATRWLLIGLGLALLAFYVAPLWKTLDRWCGTFDWSYFFFLAEVDRTTVLDYGQFPLWNPYYCGGAVHLANPQTFFLSPTFLFILAFGTPIGLRLTLTLAIGLALDGTRRFLRVLGVGPVGAFVGGAGYAVCGTLAQHLGGGHVGWVGLCVLPYVLHSFHRALDGDRRHILYGGLLMAWIFGHFGGYTFPYSALALGLHGVIWSASRGKLRAGVMVMAGILLFSLGVSALRLLPILEFMRGHPRIRPDVDVISPKMFFEIYGVRHTQRAVAGHPYVWPEYGNYLGPAALVLVAVGLGIVARRRRELLPLVWVTLGFLLFQIGNVPGFPWWLVKHLPVFRFMRVPSRFTILVGLFASVLIGVAVDRFAAPVVAGGWRRLSPPRRVAGVAVLLLAIGFLLDASSFNREQWRQTFTSPPPADPRAPSFHQSRGDRHRMQAYPRANQGTLDCFEETPLDISPRLSGSLGADEYPLDPATGTVRRLDWSPNRIVVATDFTRAGTVVVNQNYHPAWRVHATGDGGPPARLVNQEGLLAAQVGAGHHTVTFRFLPTSFLLGVAISLATLALGVWLWVRWRRPRRPARSPLDRDRYSFES